MSAAFRYRLQFCRKGLRNQVRSSFFLILILLTRITHRNFDYQSVHVAGAQRIAKIAAECGVSNFIHVSHLNASKTSPSKFYQTKAVGEEAVKAAFPTATIVRPSVMFGYEDKLLTNIAGKGNFCRTISKFTVFLVWPIWWKLNQAETKLRPVHVSFKKIIPTPLLSLNHRFWMSLKP